MSPQPAPEPATPQTAADRRSWGGLPCGFQYPTYRCDMPESVHRGEHPFQPYERRTGERRLAREPQGPQAEAQHGFVGGPSPQIPSTEAERRLAGIREVIRAANGDWHEATALWSVQNDVQWLLDLAIEREAADRAAPADRIDVELVADALHFGVVCRPLATIDPRQCVNRRERDVALAEAFIREYDRLRGSRS